MAEVHTNNGGYDLGGVVWHQHSNKLLVEILKLFPKDIPVIDLGCGHNFYVSVLNYAGYDAIGIDMVNLGSKYFVCADITEKVDLSELGLDTFSSKPINVISLEVGEHIPLEKSGTYLDNICSFGGDVLMSWAVKGQAGIGHINCQNNDWVIEQMAKRGYKFDSETTRQLRNSVADCHCSWFRNTLMYFKNK